MWPPRTLVITDRSRLGARGDGDDDARLVAYAGAIAAAGADALQLRERDWPDGRLLAVAREVVAAVAGSGCRVLVNERAHVAVAAGADGVHLRGDAMPVRRVREAYPALGLVGRSVHDDDAPSAADGADVAVFGTVFPSVSKAAGARVAGGEALAAWIRRDPRVPVVAVGGIDVRLAAVARDAGACGVAGIDLFARAWLQGQSALGALVADVHAVFADGEWHE